MHIVNKNIQFHFNINLIVSVRWLNVRVSFSYEPSITVRLRLTHLKGYSLPREGFDENLHPGVFSTFRGKTNKLLTFMSA